MLMHSSSCRPTTLTPFSRSQSMPPPKLTDSPTTTVPMLNCRTMALQYHKRGRGRRQDGGAVTALAAGYAEGVGFALHRRVFFLNAPVVAATQQSAVFVE